MEIVEARCKGKVGKLSRDLKEERTIMPDTQVPRRGNSKSRDPQAGLSFGEFWDGI